MDASENEKIIAENCLVSIIIPSYQGATCRKASVEDIYKTMQSHNWSYEIHIVGQEASPDVDHMVNSLSQSGVPVRLHILQKHHSLSSLILHGLEQSQGRYLLVMNGDGSHPVTHIPNLLDPFFKNKNTELSLGSRFCKGTEKLKARSAYESVNRFVTHILSRPVLGASINDPMSQFFVVKRSVFQRCKLFKPRGLSIALEIMVRCACRYVVEVPLALAKPVKKPRFGFKEKLVYIEHLSRLYDFRYPAITSAVKFLVVAVLGLICNLLLGKAMGYPLSPSQSILTYLPSLLVSAAFFARYIKANRELIDFPYPFLEFLAISFCEIAAVCLYVFAYEGIARPPEMIIFTGLGLLVRVVARKVYGHDLRGPALFRKELQDLIYEDESLRCPSCGSYKFCLPYIYDVDWLVRCQSCQFMFAHPQPSPQELEKIYDEHYFDEWGGKKNEDALKKMKGANFKWVVGECQKINKIKKVLDIGCGRGYTIAAGLEMGLDIYGIEPYGASLQDLDKEVSERIENCEMENSKHGAEFDLVCLFDVIEHLRDPAKMLKYVERFLAPGGVLVFTTIDAEDSRARGLGPNWFHIHKAHLWYFSSGSLKNIIKSAGMRPLCLRPGSKHYTLRFILGILKVKAGPVIRRLAAIGLVITPNFILDMILHPMGEGLFGVMVPESKTGPVTRYLDI